MKPLTAAQRGAIGWLRERHGTGVVMRDGVVLAAGERAPFMRSTWNALRDVGLLTIQNKRVTLTS